MKIFCNIFLRTLVKALDLRMCSTQNCTVTDFTVVQRIRKPCNMNRLPSGVYMQNDSIPSFLHSTNISLTLHSVHFMAVDVLYFFSFSPQTFYCFVLRSRYGDQGLVCLVQDETQAKKGTLCETGEHYTSNRFSSAPEQTSSVHVIL